MQMNSLIFFKSQISSRNNQNENHKTREEAAAAAPAEQLSPSRHLQTLTPTWWWQRNFRDVSPSVSQDREFICWRDKHKHSHIIPHKPPKRITRSQRSEIRRAIACLLWQAGGRYAFGNDIFASRLERPFRDNRASRRGREETRGEKETRLWSDPSPSIFHQCWHFFSIMSKCGSDYVPVTLWFWGWRDLCASLFYFIYFIFLARTCVHSQISESKTVR